MPKGMGYGKGKPNSGGSGTYQSGGNGAPTKGVGSMKTSKTGAAIIGKSATPRGSASPKGSYCGVSPGGRPGSYGKSGK